MKIAKEKIAASADVIYLISLMVLFSLWQTHPEVMFLLTCVYALFFLVFVLKFSVRRQVVIGLVLAFAYLTFYKDFYQYNTFSLWIFGYPLLPLVGWPVGLSLLSYYINMLLSILKVKKMWIKMTLSYGTYLVMLIILEYSAYHYLNIRLASQYASLPLIDCLHVPASMKAAYFLNGLIFFLLYFHFTHMRQIRYQPMTLPPPLPLRSITVPE